MTDQQIRTYRLAYADALNGDALALAVVCDMSVDAGHSGEEVARHIALAQKIGIAASFAAFVRENI
jgi:hypothetical protein